MLQLPVNLQELLIHSFLCVALKEANKDLLSKGEWRGWGSKIAFQTMKFWFWICSRWVPESSIQYFVSMQSLHGLIFVCMKWASKGAGALWLFTALWDQCICGSFFQLWQQLLSNSAISEWGGEVVGSQGCILSAGCVGSQHNGSFHCQALLPVFGSGWLNFPWCSLHTGLARERGPSYIVIVYCPCMLERKKWALQCHLSV